MKTYIQYYIAAFFGLILLVGCSPQDETTPTTPGDADFSTYVAFGNSLTAGYADNALYQSGQEVSYANLLGERFQHVGGGEFKVPFTHSEIGINADGGSRLVLGVVDGEPAPVPADPSGGDLSIFQNSVADQGPFNNMGVPGATVLTSVFPGYGNPANGAGNFNPFFTRMTSDPQNASMLSDAIAQDPTFFTVFIGNNDVLGYATAGGANPNAQITPIGQFSAAYDQIIEAFTQNGVKGAVATIPDVTSTAFFTTIPYNALVLSEEQAAQLNDGVDQMIDALGVDRETIEALGIVLPKFHEGPNALLMVDDDPSNLMGIRPMEEGELVTLTAQDDLMALQQNLGNADVVFAQIAQAVGQALATGDFSLIKQATSQLALPDQDVLDADEVVNVEQATEAYNQKIKDVAAQNDLAFVDVNAFLKNIAQNGIEINGKKVTPEFVTGGVFSLDGIHLTPVANAALANLFIEAINKKYNAFIPQVDYANFGEVKLP